MLFDDKSKSIAQAYLRMLEEAKKKEGPKMDPVGKEDGDVDNDGDMDSSDSYLKNRRKAISKSVEEASSCGMKSSKKEEVEIAIGGKSKASKNGMKKDDGGDDDEEDDDMDDMEDDDMDDDDEDEDEVEVKKAKKPSMEKEGYKSDAQRKAVWASRNEKGMKEAVRNPYAIGMATAMKSSGDEPPLEKSTITKAHKIAKSIMKKESTVWNWDQILEASDEELDSLIEQLNDEDFDSFAHEFYEFTEMYAKAKQGVSKEGQEKLEPRAPAEKAFVNMHRRVVSDEPEGIVDRSAVKAQSPIRPGDKRSGEPMKTVKSK